MKKILTSITIVVAFMIFMAITVSAFTTSVLSNPNYSYNNGFKYVEKTVSEGGTQKIFYGEYNTTAEDAEYEWVIHSIRDGSETTLSTVMNIANDYEAQTGNKVMLAINGDYFYNTGANVDSYVNNGIVITKGNMANKNCIGFDNNGKVVVGRMTEVETRLVVYNANGEPQFFEIDKYNQQPAEGEIAIYNAAGTYTVANAGAMVVKADSSNLTSYPVWGSDYTMTATGVQTSKTFTLKSGQYAVVYTSTHNDVFGKHKYGEKVDMVEIPAGEFAGCTWVVGGYDKLVDNFTVNTNCHTDNSGNAAAPRTFFGFKEDGTGFVCVVDGRGAGGSTGITVNQEAQLASVLGAQFAIELDGGGSSTMIVRINDTLTLRNSPSDGSMRRVSNAVLLVQKPHEHKWSDATCTEAQTCQCGEKQGTALGHSFENGVCTVCSTPDPDYVPPHTHVWSDATCTEAQKCECGEAQGEALGHEFNEGVCTRCGAADSNDVPHVHNFVDGVCECGEQEAPVTAQPTWITWIRSIIVAIIKFFMGLFS